MAYTKTTWVDGQTPVNAQNMNNIENGIKANANDIISLKADNLANIKNINTLTEGLADANNTITSQGQTIQTNTSAIASLKTKTSTLEDTKMTFIDMQNAPRNLTNEELVNIVDNYLNYAIITKIGTDYVVFVFDTIANNEIIFRGLHTYNKGNYVYQDVLVFDDTTGKLIRNGANDTGIASKEWVNSLPSGTNVVANPSGEGTTDLTKLQVGNTIYNIPQGTPTDELLGTWVFNDNLSLINNSYYLSFTTANYECTGLSTSNINLSFTVSMIGSVRAYSEGSWTDDEYKTITITDTSALTNREEFTTWLKANATKQGSSGGGTQLYKHSFLIETSGDIHSAIPNITLEIISNYSSSFLSVQDVYNNFFSILSSNSIINNSGMTLKSNSLLYFTYGGDILYCTAYLPNQLIELNCDYSISDTVTPL